MTYARYFGIRRSAAKAKAAELLDFVQLAERADSKVERPMEVAFGELLWAMAIDALYSAAFLAIMAGLGLTGPAWALAAFPATLLVGFAFGGLGMALSTFMRSWQDFDLLGTIQFALFLFSGTFAPIGSYPAPLRVLVQLTPLYRGVELVRGLTTASVHPVLLVHAGYLVAMTGLGLAVAGRRMGRLLLR